MPKGLNYSLLCGALLSLALANNASAQSSSPASCLVAPASLSDSIVQAFLSSPESLLSEFQTGGIPMSNRVRALTGTNEAALSPLIKLAGQANPSQVAALGAGLARAAAACVSLKPDFAARIQQEVAETDNAALQTAFAGAMPETETAALGAAGAGASGAGAAGASAIGSNGNAGGGVNATGTAADGSSGTASGDSAFSAGASSPYFATSSAGSSTFISISITTQ